MEEKCALETSFFISFSFLNDIGHFIWPKLLGILKENNPRLSVVINLSSLLKYIINWFYKQTKLKATFGSKSVAGYLALYIECVERDVRG